MKPQPGSADYNRLAESRGVPVKSKPMKKAADSKLVQALAQGRRRTAAGGKA